MAETPRPTQSCQSCEHHAVCALRKGFDAPMRRLVKSNAEDDTFDDDLAELALRIHEVVYHACPSAN